MLLQAFFSREDLVLVELGVLLTGSEQLLVTILTAHLQQELRGFCLLNLNVTRYNGNDIAGLVAGNKSILASDSLHKSLFSRANFLHETWFFEALKPPILILTLTS